MLPMVMGYGRHTLLTEIGQRGIINDIVFQGMSARS